MKLQKLTKKQLKAVKEFEKEMQDNVIPEIERVMLKRAKLAQESRKWIVT